MSPTSQVTLLLKSLVSGCAGRDLHEDLVNATWFSWKKSPNPPTPNRNTTYKNEKRHYLVDILVFIWQKITTQGCLGLHVGGPTTQFLARKHLS